MPKTNEPRSWGAYPKNDLDLQIVSVWDIPYGPPTQKKKQTPPACTLILLDAIANEVNGDTAPGTGMIH